MLALGELWPVEYMRGVSCSSPDCTLSAWRSRTEAASVPGGAMAFWPTSTSTNAGRLPTRTAKASNMRHSVVFPVSTSPATSICSGRWSASARPARGARRAAPAAPPRPCARHAPGVSPFPRASSPWRPCAALAGAPAAPCPPSAASRHTKKKSSTGRPCRTNTASPSPAPRQSAPRTPAAAARGARQQATCRRPPPAPRAHHHPGRKLTGGVEYHLVVAGQLDDALRRHRAPGIRRKGARGREM